MTSLQQTVVSDCPAAAVQRSADGVSQDGQDLGQDHSSGLQTHRPSASSGDAEPSSLASQTVSSTDTNQQGVCEHGDRISENVSQHTENQADDPQQMLDIGLLSLETASQSSVDSSHTALAEGAQPAQQTSPPGPSGANSTISGSEGLAHDQDEEKPALRPPISESLGLWTCAIIAGGTAITLAVLGFLIFLWLGEGQAGGEGATYVWRKIMLSESWPVQTITIFALVVRTIAAAQGAVCTSLVAALLLERRRLPLSKVVPVSIKRGVNDGPFNLVCDLLSWKNIQRLFCTEMALLLFVTMMTSGIQFTSTSLLSGFDATTLVDFPQQLHRNVILSTEAASKALMLNSYSQFPPSYALFGEWATSDTIDPDARGVSDTGVKLRSFVPFQKEARTKLRSYRGPAFSQKTQIMCMRPSIDAQIFWYKVISETGNSPASSISGTISWENTLEEAGLDELTLCSSIEHFDGTSQTICLPQNFTCTFPLRDDFIMDPLPVIGLYHLQAVMVGNNQTSYMNNLQMWNASSPLWSANAHSWVYLTFSTNLTAGAVDKEITNNEGASVSLPTPTGKAGEWHTYQILPTMYLNISLCFAGLRTDIHDVSMYTATDPQEPEVRWDLTYHDEDGAEPGQRFMGTTGSNLSITERGIMSIMDFRYPDSLKADDINDSSRTLYTGPSSFTGMFAGENGGSWIMCNFCVFRGWAIPPDIAALFARTIHTTGRAGWAIQNFLTTYTESWYAQILPQFDVAAEIDVTFSTQVRIPRHWGGLIAVLVLVIVNLACVWAITVLYVVHTRYSRQGNVWHTVSQIISDDTRPVLEQSNQVKDDDVERQLKADDYLVFLGRPKGSENVSVLRC